MEEEVTRKVVDIRQIALARRLHRRLIEKNVYTGWTVPFILNQFHLCEGEKGEPLLLDLRAPDQI